MTFSEAILISILPLAASLLCIRAIARLERGQLADLLLISSLFFMSAAQTLAYLSGAVNTELMFNFAHCYLMGIFWMATSLVIYVYHLGQKHSPAILYLYIAPLILSVMHMAGFLTNGFRLQDGHPMHLDGEFSIIGDFYLLACVVTCGFLIYQNLRRVDSAVWLSKNLFLLLALVPLVIITGTGMLLSMTKYAIPLAIVGPVTILYVVGVFSYLSRPTVVNLSMGLDLLFGRLSLIKAIAVAEYTPDTIKSLKSDLERQGLAEAYEQNEGSVYKTAEYLGVDHSTVRKKIKLFNIARKPAIDKA